MDNSWSCASTQLLRKIARRMGRIKSLNLKTSVLLGSEEKYKIHLILLEVAQMLIELQQTRHLLCAFKKLKKNGFYRCTKHCTVKHLNNLIEQNHRHVKRCFAKSSGFQSIRHASRTIKGIETIHALYKQKRSLQQNRIGE